MLKIPDYILIAVLIVFAISFNFIFFSTTNSIPTERLEVSVSGVPLEAYDLNVDGVYTLETGPNNSHSNTFEIKDGVVTMIEANCPDQNCTYFAPIQLNNEIIICLPNEMVLQIASEDPEKESEVDSISQ